MSTEVMDMAQATGDILKPERKVEENVADKKVEDLTR